MKPLPIRHFYTGLVIQGCVKLFSDFVCIKAISEEYITQYNYQVAPTELTLDHIFNSMNRVLLQST